MVWLQILLCLSTSTADSTNLRSGPCGLIKSLFNKFGSWLLFVFKLERLEWEFSERVRDVPF